MSRQKATGVAPSIPDGERNRRLDRTRTRLEACGLNGLVVYGSGPTAPDAVRYLTGHVHVFPRSTSVFVLPVEGAPILLIDRSWYRAETREATELDDVRTVPASFHEDRRTLEATLETALADAGLTDKTVGLLNPSDCPAAFVDALKRAAPGVDTAAASSLWRDLVGSPTAYDRERIAEAAEIADAGLETVRSACRSGRSEQAVCFEALERMGELGAEFLHANAISTHIDIGSYSRGRSNLQPFLYTNTELEADEMFWVDLIVCHEGYYIDCDRTISIGDPTDEQRAVYDTCRAMYDAMVASIEPGVSGREIWQAGYDVAAEAGYEEYLNAIYLGHTTGPTVSEAPFVERTESRSIRSGQFLNVEPGLFVPGVGSACIENTIHVTDAGVEVLNETDLELHVV